MKTKPKKPTNPGREPVGRPAADVAYDDNYAIRMTPEDRQRWGELARASGMKLSQWIRFHCAKAAGADVAVVSVEFKTSYPGDKASGIVVDEQKAPSSTRVVQLGPL